MLQSQLQFERHRREVHAERNRRLLAKAKGVRLVEEELHTMRLQLAQAHNEMTALRKDAETMRRHRNAAETERSLAVIQFEERTRKMLQEVEELSAGRSQCEDELAATREEARTLRRETDRLNGQLFAVKAEMNDLRRQANESRRFQHDLKDSQYHLIAARETANLLQQQLMNPIGPVLKFELEETTRAYKGFLFLSYSYFSFLHIFIDRIEFISSRSDGHSVSVSCGHSLPPPLSVRLTGHLYVSVTSFLHTNNPSGLLSFYFLFEISGRADMIGQFWRHIMIGCCCFLF